MLAQLSCPYDEFVPELVAIDLPTSHLMFRYVLEEWDRGNAVAPIDQRLGDEMKRRLVTDLAPARIIDSKGDTRRPNSIPTVAGDALVMMTSGSTGTPRWAIHTHHSIQASARASAARLGSEPGDHWLLCLPASHVGGFSVFSRARHSGSNLTIHDGFDRVRVEDAARTGVTHVSLVATALRRIDPSLFRVILLGGSRAPSLLPNNVVTTYGMTETMGGVFYDGLPLDGVETSVVDDEIVLRAPMLMSRYRGEAPIGDWFPTGDLGELSPEGRLVVHGRRGDLIVTGGEKVWPQDVESALLEHAGIKDCAVRGLEDEEWGQRVVAWVVPEGSDPSLADIRGWIRERLSSYHAPKELRVVTAIPRTALGKVDQPRLLGAPWR